MRPIDPVTTTEAASILGCTVRTVHSYVDDGRLAAAPNYEHRGLERADVEELATHVYAWIRHRHDPDPYWVAGQHASDTLGVHREALDRLTLEDKVDCLLHQDGTRLYRRQQLIAIHHTRDARTWA